MPKGKKKFIDKKSAVTFHLVHRSQQDPLIADETAPQHVLLPTVAAKKSKNEDKKRKEEQKKYGILFDDDYNYLQHLRDADQIEVHWEPVPSQHIKEDDSVAKLQLPSSVFASHVEEDIGLLNKAAPHSGLRLNLDPDVVAAMDEDFDFDNPDNQLEDNFIDLANADNDDCEYDETGSDASSDDCMGQESEEEQDDEIRSLNGSQFMFADEETKSCFTNYSMSSSVIRRNEQLSLLDSRFEQLYLDYDDNEIGALDCDEIEGYIAPDSAIVLQCAEEFEHLQDTHKPETDHTINAVHHMSSECDDSELIDVNVPDDTADKWDCESILSVYSNIYNHPKLITEPIYPGHIRISDRTGIPMNVLDGGRAGKLTAHALAKLDASNIGSGRRAASVMSTISVLSIRPQNESPEEKKERKKAIKEYRKERRIERKANSQAFKEEKMRQEKVVLNNKSHQQGIKIV